MMAGAGRRCVMRIVCIAQADIAAVATMLVGKLTELLSELCKARTPCPFFSPPRQSGERCCAPFFFLSRWGLNAVTPHPLQGFQHGQAPKTPAFHHYIFESLAAVTRHIAADPVAIASVEEFTLPPFQAWQPTVRARAICGPLRVSHAQRNGHRSNGERASRGSCARCSTGASMLY